jgi:LuxR family maltose regulon positive regulatory protein
MQALAYHGLKQETNALSSLKRALTLGAPEHFVRTFVRAGPELLPCLQLARFTGFMPEYIDTLLAAFHGEKSPRPASIPSQSELFEPLSEREMDVLKLLAQGFTDKKIASNLVIARETVHKHLKNMYGKLGVHSRTEAIQPASSSPNSSN